MAGEYANRRIGDFQLLELMKQHGSIEMYRGTQNSFRRLVLFKIISISSLFENDERLIRAFNEHIRKVVGLEHLHLQPIYSFGELDEEHLYVVGRLISGSLSDFLKVGPLSLEQALKLALQAASALIYIHTQGVTHYSLSPYNLYVGEDQNIYINDLELSPIVRAVHSLHDLSILLEVPYYTSVEQLQLQPLTVRSEVYAFGAILYHMVVGKPPFSDEGNSFDQVLKRKASNDLVHPRLIDPAIPAQLENIILRALRANRDERYADVATMNRDLEQLSLVSSLLPSEDKPRLNYLQSFIARLRPKA